MTDRELLAAVVDATYPQSREYDARACILRSGRWGTCVECPRMDGARMPERCIHTERHDHQLSWTRNGQFYFDDHRLVGDRLQQRAQLRLRIEQAKAET